ARAALARGVGGARRLTRRGQGRAEGAAEEPREIPQRGGEVAPERRVETHARLEVERADLEHAARSIEARVDAPDERVAAQHGHDEVAPAALSLGRVDLENDAHPEERLRPRPVADEVVERREQRRASAPPSIDRARGAQVRDADEPLARQRSVLAADLDLADPPGLNERRERGV